MKPIHLAVGLGAIACSLAGSPAWAAPGSGDGADLLALRATELAARSPIGPGPEPAAPEKGARTDTTWFGSYTVVGDEYHAVPSSVKPDVVWTFDRGIGPYGDPGRIDGAEGWAAINLTEDPQVFVRVIDGTLDLGPGVAAPILEGDRSLWVGASAPEANAYGYDCLAGYGDGWDQEATSEPLSYSGSGFVQLSFLYFQDSESGFDGTQVFLQRANGSRLLLNPSGNPNLGFTGRIGIDAQGNVSPVLYSRAITQAEIGGAQAIRIVIAFRSDGGYSDEDCGYPTPKGAFAADEISVQGGGIDRLWSFEEGAGGWTFAAVPGIPDEAGVADFDCYQASVPCLQNNVLEAHADSCAWGTHPVGQVLRLESPICDLGPQWDSAFLEYDSYWEEREPSYFPIVIWRPGWRYFPAPGPLGDRWSDRVGPNTFYVVFLTECVPGARLSTAGYVPPAAERVMAVIEIGNMDSDLVGRFPGPLLDNLVVGVTGLPDPEGLEPLEWPRGFELSIVPNPSIAGANVSYRLNQPATSVRLEVLDVTGRMIRRLDLDGSARAAGSIRWDGIGEDGRAAPAGAYWIRLRADGATEGRKFILLD
jgi:hypothetical protein